MVVNTLKISFCADHSWREGASESSGEGRTKGGGERKEEGEGCFFFLKSKIDVTHEREKDRGGRFFSWNLHSFVYLPSDFMHIVVCSA